MSEHRRVVLCVDKAEHGPLCAAGNEKPLMYAMTKAIGSYWQCNDIGRLGHRVNETDNLDRHHTIGMWIDVEVVTDRIKRSNRDGAGNWVLRFRRSCASRKLCRGSTGLKSASSNNGDSDEETGEAEEHPRKPHQFRV